MAQIRNEKAAQRGSLGGRISHGHLGVIRADVPGHKHRSRPSKLWKKTMDSRESRCESPVPLRGRVISSPKKLEPPFGNTEPRCIWLPHKMLGQKEFASHQRVSRSGDVRVTPSDAQRAQRSKKVILARTHEKNHSTIPLRTRTILAWNFHSRFEMFIPAWKFQSRAWFFCTQRGARNEKTILDWKVRSVLKELHFFNIASRDWIFSILGPSGHANRIEKP